MRRRGLARSRRRLGVSRRRLAAGYGLRLRRPCRLGGAAHAGAHALAKRCHVVGLAEHFEQRVAVVTRGEDVAAQRHLGVGALGGQGFQAVEARAQRVERGEVALEFFEVEAGGQGLAVLVEDGAPA